MSALSNAATPRTMLGRLQAMLASVLDRLADPFAFATRVYVGWQFFKSGMLKIGSWETTLGLFQDEYHVPLLPPALAAVAGTAGELFFPVLLALGLALLKEWAVLAEDEEPLPKLRAVVKAPPD